VTQAGNISYFAAELLHDDTVTARYLMYSKAQRGPIPLGSTE
jgi:hypothetical protein